MIDNEATDLLLKYKESCNMNDIEWYKFCKRYATRNVSTVIWLLSAKYGKLPKRVRDNIQSAMAQFCTPPDIDIKE